MISLELLNIILKRNEPFEQIISSSDKFNKLEIKNKKFCRLIITIVLRKLGQIDFVIDKFIKKGSIKKEIFKNIIRIGIAEILFIRSAKYAAINEAVELTKLKVSRSLSKLTNAVLRNIDRDSKGLILQMTDDQNYPHWLIEEWKNSWGERQTKEILKWFQEKPLLDISVAGNPIKMEKILGGKNIFGKTIRKKEITNPTSIPYFETNDENYHWWVQDVAASIPAELLIKSNKINIVDLCSAPGGKTAQLAKAGKTVTAVDISQNRTIKLKENIQRLKLNIKIIIADGTKWKPQQKYQAVLLDAPCSATGTLRRHPDIIKNRSKYSLNNYLQTQLNLINQSITWLEKNGLLIYSVCSLQENEGEKQIKSVLKNNKDIIIQPILPSEVPNFEHSITKEGWLRIFPNCLDSMGGNDGFFICKLQKL